MLPIAIVFITMLVPLGGIFSYTYLKAKKLELEKAKMNPDSATAGVVKELAKQVLELQKDNEALRKRIENLEVIATANQDVSSLDTYSNRERS